MANFEAAYSFLAPHEYNSSKVLSNDPNDPGGLTKYGISSKAFPNEDIANLTMARAKDLTKIYYWNPANLYLIENQNVANALLDYFFQSGLDEIYKVQRLLINRFGKNLGTTGPNGDGVDGDLGRKTAEAINSIDPNLFGQNLVKMREAYYRTLGVWDHYEKNFLNRLGNNYALFDGVKKKTLMGVIVVAAVAGAIWAYNSNQS